MYTKMQLNKLFIKIIYHILAPRFLGLNPLVGRGFLNGVFFFLYFLLNIGLELFDPGYSSGPLSSEDLLFSESLKNSNSSMASGGGELLIRLIKASSRASWHCFMMDERSCIDWRMQADISRVWWMASLKSVYKEGSRNWCLIVKGKNFLGKFEPAPLIRMADIDTIH